MKNNQTEVGNEMEIFLTLTKYNTCLRYEEGKSLFVVYNIICILTPPLTIVSTEFMRNGTYPLMLIGMVYNTLFIGAQGNGYCYWK